MLPNDPGFRNSGFDFRAHIPGLRNLVTIYVDAYAHDDLNPIDAPRRNVWSPGVYFARLPFLPHVDLRVEAVSSEEMSQDEAGYRQDKISEVFLPHGGTISDGFFNATWEFHKEWNIKAFSQYERFLIPSFMPGSQHNVSGWLQITWNPKFEIGH